MVSVMDVKSWSAGGETVFICVATGGTIPTSVHFPSYPIPFPHTAR